MRFFYFYSIHSTNLCWENPLSTHYNAIMIEIDCGPERGREDKNKMNERI